MKKILLVSPVYKSVSPCWELHTIPVIRKKSFIVPLHLATIAALTPEDIKVDLWDEFVHGWIDEKTSPGTDYDLVGITCNDTTTPRAKEIASFFRKQNIPVALGGPGVSSEISECRGFFDVLFIGEAELTWPQFLKDFYNGNYKPEYRQDNFPELSLSPPPRWDSLAEIMRKSYLLGGVQTSRGCPFACEFCSSWQHSGRKMRLKPVSQVLEEIRALERLGMGHILFCVDNFFGDPDYAKELLKKMIPLNNSFLKPLRFRAEISLNIAQDEEMLSLLADANFNGLFIGIESPNLDSLKDARKLQNLRGDLIQNCRKILSYGMAIEGSLIVGFDHDTTSIFRDQFQFLQDTGIPVPKLHLLKANRGTKLWERMLQEGRLLDIKKISAGNTSAIYVDPRVITNIIPRKMSRIQLFSGYIDLIRKVYDWDNFADRIIKFVSLIDREPIPAGPEADLSQAAENWHAFVSSLDEKARAAIARMYAYTHKQAPARMHQISTLIVRQYMESAEVPRLIDTLKKQINYEKSRGMEQFKLQNPVLLGN